MPAIDADTLEVRNEFAAVLLRLNTSGNSARLEIRDLESGALRALDAYTLRSLALASPATLRALCAATVPREPDAPAPAADPIKPSERAGTPG
jgi:hypothetical protein